MLPRRPLQQLAEAADLSSGDGHATALPTESPRPSDRTSAVIPFESSNGVLELRRKADSADVAPADQQITTLLWEIVELRQRNANLLNEAAERTFESSQSQQQTWDPTNAQQHHRSFSRNESKPDPVAPQRTWSRTAEPEENRTGAARDAELAKQAATVRWQASKILLLEQQLRHAEVEQEAAEASAAQAHLELKHSRGGRDVELDAERTELARMVELQASHISDLERKLRVAQEERDSAAVAAEQLRLARSEQEAIVKQEQERARSETAALLDEQASRIRDLELRIQESNRKASNGHADAQDALVRELQNKLRSAELKLHASPARALTIPAISPFDEHLYKPRHFPNNAWSISICGSNMFLQGPFQNSWVFGGVATYPVPSAGKENYKYPGPTFGENDAWVIFDAHATGADGERGRLNYNEGFARQYPFLLAVMRELEMQSEGAKRIFLGPFNEGLVLGNKGAVKGNLHPGVSQTFRKFFTSQDKQLAPSGEAELWLGGERTTSSSRAQPRPYEAARAAVSVEWVALGIEGTCVIRFSIRNEKMQTYAELGSHYHGLKKWLFREGCEPIALALDPSNDDRWALLYKKFSPSGTVGFSVAFHVGPAVLRDDSDQTGGLMEDWARSNMVTFERVE